MKIVTSILVFLALSLSMTTFSEGTQPLTRASAAQVEEQLVYADFETVMNNRPVSSRGGYIQIQGGSENPGNPAKFTGMPGANDAPELVRLKADDPNKAAMFSYVLTSPNNYANVTLDIHGLPDKDGKPAPEDVSAYKNVTLQIYAKGVPPPTGVQYIRIEFTSHGQGFGIKYGFPQATFKISPTGFNTYKIPLKSLAQPSYVDRVDMKEVLKKLTSIQISVYCDNKCTPSNGTVVIDNVVLTK